MRKWVVIICLITVTGCANRQQEYVAPGVDREEMAATIARQGQESAHDAAPPRREDTFLEKAGGYTLFTVAGAGACVIAAPFVLGFLVLKGMTNAQRV